MATWLLRPPAMSSRRRRSSAVMVMNAGSRDPQSLTMARRVSSCVVNGPGVNSSGDSGTSTSLLGGASVGMLGDHAPQSPRSEEHTSELQSRGHLVCRLLLEKKKKKKKRLTIIKKKKTR